MQLKVNNHFWIVLILTFLMGLIQFWMRQDIIQRFYFLLIGMIIICFFWTLLSLKGIELKRFSKSYREELGKVIEERFEIHNKSRLPKMWIEILDQSILPGVNGSRIITSIKPGQTRVFQNLRRLTRRGEYKLGPTIIKSGDPFGLFSFEKLFEADNSLLVLPFFFSISSLKSSPGQLSGRRAIRKTSHNKTAYASGVREYKPGDSLSRIHWRSTAKKERFMVKEFEEEPQSNIWIFLDADEKHVFCDESANIIDEEIIYNKSSTAPRYYLPNDSFEYEVAISASLLDYFIRENRAVGLTCMSKRIIVHSPEKGKRQQSKIIDTLAFVQPDGDLPISALLQSQAAGLTKGVNLIVVTANTSSEIINVLEQLNRRGAKITVIFVDGHSFGNQNTSENINQFLETRGFKTVNIKCGDDVKNVLQISNGMEGLENYYSNSG